MLIWDEGIRDTTPVFGVFKPERVLCMENQQRGNV